jgi:dUTP pyrophosphatase
MSSAIVVQIKKLRPDAKLPYRASVSAAGADLFACLTSAVTIFPGGTELIPTGIAVALPEGFAGLVYARSGLATKKGLAPANKVGVIDPDYRGEVLVALHNHSTEPAVVEPGERIAQLVITPFLGAVFSEVSELEETERGDGGFGSTGIK